MRIEVNPSPTTALFNSPAEKAGIPAFANAIDRLYRSTVKAIDEWLNTFVLSDRGVDERHVAIPSLLALSAVFVVVLGAAAIVITLYLSHHIAGPLYAIRRYLESISRGELDFQPRLRLRDQTTPLSQSLAHAIETLNSRLVAIRSAADGVRTASARLPRHLNSLDESTAECRKDLEDLLAREDALIRDLYFFRLRTPAEKP